MGSCDPREPVVVALPRLTDTVAFQNQGYPHRCHPSRTKGTHRTRTHRLQAEADRRRGSRAEGAAPAPRATLPLLQEASAGGCQLLERVRDGPCMGPGQQELWAMVTEDRGSEEGSQSPEKAVSILFRRGSQRVSRCPGAPQRREGPPTGRQSLPHIAASWTEFRGCSPANVPPSPFVRPPAWRTPSQGFHAGSHLGSPDSSSSVLSAVPSRDQLLQGG